MCAGKRKRTNNWWLPFHENTIYRQGKRNAKKDEKSCKNLLTGGRWCGIITKLSREGGAEKTKQRFGPGGSKKSFEKGVDTEGTAWYNKDLLWEQQTDLEN